MVVDILIAILLSVLIYAVATLICRKLPVPAEFVWVVWTIAIILIVLVWWRFVIGALVGPIP